MDAATSEKLRALNAFVDEMTSKVVQLESEKAELLGWLKVMVALVPVIAGVPSHTVEYAKALIARLERRDG